MSLTYEGFTESIKQWEEMDIRLNKLLGFNPATSNHYGIIQLYNNRISAKTTDNEILDIRKKYVRWKKEILGIFKDNKYTISDEEFSKLFSVDYMYGTISFLGTSLDLNNGKGFYNEIIKNYIKEK